MSASNLPSATRTLLALSLAAAFGGFAATAVRDALHAPAHASPAAIAAPVVGALPNAVDGQPMPSLAPMLARVTPAVVSVHTKQVVQIRNPFANDPMFRRLFPNVPQERINESLGSGVVVDAANGYVLTNHHVIENADEVSVTLSDGRTLPAEFVGSDPDTDIAVMRIEADNLQALPLADSEALRVGDFVVAVGNPFGLSQTVTSGIVSAVGRSGIRGLGYQDFIQTDASINPGNSGGALVNLRGELIGINAASFNPRGSAAGNIGLGFAIPSNLAREVMRQLMAYGEVRRGSLGLDSRDLTPALAGQLDLPANARGALVARVYRGSPAEAAGVQPGDLVVAANGQRIDSAQQLHNLEGLLPVGKAVRLDLQRDGRTLSVNATLKAQPREVDGATLDPRLAGATFSELPERYRQQGVSGVVVAKVTPGSRAARNQLDSGDLVLAINRRQVVDLNDFRTRFSPAPATMVLMLQRGSARGELPMR